LADPPSKLLVLFTEGAPLRIEALHAPQHGLLYHWERSPIPGREGLIAVPESNRESRIGLIDTRFRIRPIVQCGDIKRFSLQQLFPSVAWKVQETLRHQQSRVRLRCRVPGIQGEYGEEQERMAAIQPRLTPGRRLSKGSVRPIEIPIRHMGETDLEYRGRERFGRGGFFEIAASRCEEEARGHKDAASS
jgi:hypothetical protein